MHTDVIAHSIDGNYLFTEVAERVAAEPVRIIPAAQLVDDSDVVDDATVSWLWTDDPLLELRVALYLLSGRKRRTA